MYSYSNRFEEIHTKDNETIIDAIRLWSSKWSWSDDNKLIGIALQNESVAIGIRQTRHDSPY